MTETITHDELQELKQSVRGFLERHSTIADVRRLMGSEEGFDASVWDAFAEQLAFPSLTIPEEYGGAGFGPVAQGIAMEEIGRSLLVAPVLSSSVAATNVILSSDDEQAKAELLPPLAEGTARGTLAVVEQTWEQGSSAPTTVAVLDSDGTWKLTGAKHRVLDGGTATFFVVTAQTADGIGLFVVDRDASGVSTTDVPTVDLTRSCASVGFAAAPAVALGTTGSAPRAFSAAMDLTAIALAAEQVGAAQGALDLTVAYMKLRHQFGRPIGSFQALKHRCADLHGAIETARAVTSAALRATESGDRRRVSILAPLAKTRSWDVLDTVSAQCIQLQGGMGFTWEVDAHLYFKRARGNQYVFGDPTALRESAAGSLGLLRSAS